MGCDTNHFQRQKGIIRSDTITDTGHGVQACPIWVSPFPDFKVMAGYQIRQIFIRNIATGREHRGKRSGARPFAVFQRRNGD